MDTGSTSRPLQFIALKLANSVFISLLVVTGLLMIPVSCTCGAAIPHGHSLFQLPHHNHASTDAHAGHETPNDAVVSLDQFMKDWECVGSNGDATNLHHKYHFALSNVLEQHDGTAVQAPPSSSIGHPIAMTQSSMIALPCLECQVISLPPTQTLQGAEPLPETPPPRQLTLL
jgi:hypothetical protein